MSIERLVFKLHISEWGYRIITILAIPLFALLASCSKNVLNLNNKQY